EKKKSRRERDVTRKIRRIKRLWRDVRTCVTSKYYNELHLMEKTCMEQWWFLNLTAQ
ncbi:hypothetical protein CHARACLAT_029046, partial [Characodon lateralis]|nr:hypothetical protein [Characodon lateralis]